MNAKLPMLPTADENEISKTIETLFPSDAVVELRVIYNKGRKRTDAGYFDGEHRSELIAAAIKANQDGVNVYVTLNPVDPKLLGRYRNRVKESAPVTTADKDITRRRWLLIDIDPARSTTNTSATDEQLQQAKKQAIVIYKFLHESGWPGPVCAQSGNGVHLLYRLDLTNDNEARHLIASVLKTLGERFDTKGVKVDRSVSNASRIIKLHGTVATKGNHTEQTPWRLSRITSIPQELVKVSLEQLRAIIPPSTKFTHHDDKLNADFKVNTGTQDLPVWLPDALKFIDPQPYKEWLDVGMALHQATEGSEAGLKIFIDWSSAAVNFDQESCKDKWASFGNNQGKMVTLGTIYHLAQEGGWTAPPAPAENLTDAGNGKRLIRHFGEDLRFVPETGKWLMYDNGRWEWDNDGGLNRCAKKTTSLMVQDARNIKDDEQRQRLIKHALASENCFRLKAMIDLAATEQEAVLRQSSLDRNPDLFGVATGVLNLKTGEIRSGRREDFLTKKSNVALTPSTNSCLEWLGFLEKVMAGSQELIKYLKRAMGYSLTGHTTEQCLFFLHGLGANGKSTFLNVLQGLMGDYCMTIDPETIMLKSNSGGATPELARLMGARAVITNEIEEGKRLAENSIKQMTGGDTMIARHLYQEPFEFKPEFKIWMAGNHKPTIKGTDHAIWRRIHLVPFTVTIPKEEQDPLLTKKLKAELPGILQWAVEGVKEWRRIGLNPPKQVKAAVENYRDEMDTMGHWLTECCTFNNESKTESSILYQSYKAWCQLNGHYPQSQTRFGTALGERGLKKIKAGTINWVGIVFNPPPRYPNV